MHASSLFHPFGGEELLTRSCPGPGWQAGVPGSVCDDVLDGSAQCGETPARRGLGNLAIGQEPRADEIGTVHCHLVCDP